MLLVKVVQVPTIDAQERSRMGLGACDVSYDADYARSCKLIAG
jgi:hypothetical protein